MRINPVLDREVRERMRRTRTMVLLTLFLLVLGGIFLLAFLGYSGGSFETELQATQVAKLGRGTFEWLIFFMLLLVLFIVPAMTAGSISGERERQTLVPVQVTLLRPISIVIGKIQGSMAFLGLLFVAALPLVSVSFAIGGLSLFDALAGLGAVLFAGFVVACVSAACSSATRRTPAATVLAYTIVLTLSVGTFIVYGIGSALARGQAPVSILTLNPLMTTSTLAGGKTATTFEISTPLQGMRSIVQPPPRGWGISGPSQSVSASNTSNDARNFGAGSVAVLSGVAALALWFAATRVATPARKER